MITPDPVSIDSGRFSSARTPTPPDMDNTTTKEAAEPSKPAMTTTKVPKKSLKPETYLPVQDLPVELVRTDDDLTKCRICFILFEDNETEHDIMKHMKKHNDKLFYDNRRQIYFFDVYDALQSVGSERSDHRLIRKSEQMQEKALSDLSNPTETFRTGFICLKCQNRFFSVDGAKIHFKNCSGEKLLRMFCRCCNLLLQSKDHRNSHYAKGSCFPAEESLQKILERANEANLKRKRRNYKTQDKLSSSSVDLDDSNTFQKRRCIPAKDVPVINLSDSPTDESPELGQRKSSSSSKTSPALGISICDPDSTLFQSFAQDSRKDTSVYGPTEGYPYSAACSFYDGFKPLPGYTKGNWPPLESQKVKEIFNAYDPLLPQPPSQNKAPSDMMNLGSSTLSMSVGTQQKSLVQENVERKSLLQKNIDRKVDEALAKFGQNPLTTAAAETTATRVTSDPALPHPSVVNNNSLKFSTSLFSPIMVCDSQTVADHSDSSNLGSFGMILPTVPEITRTAPPVVWNDPSRDPRLSRQAVNVTYTPDVEYVNPRDPRLMKRNPSESYTRSIDSVGDFSIQSNNGLSLSETVSFKDHHRISRPSQTLSQSPLVKTIPLDSHDYLLDPRSDVDLLENSKLVVKVKCQGGRKVPFRWPASREEDPDFFAQKGIKFGKIPRKAWINKGLWVYPFEEN